MCRMSNAEATSARMLERLVEATNAHDVDAVVRCFALDYVNETPVHPARGFVGADQVRRNWEQIFGFVPDLRATVSRQVVAADEVWSEWQMSGTRPDGSQHLMRGVIIFTVRDGRASRASFYLEPVDLENGDVDAAVRSIGEPPS
jgi:ketosteroid isomerase-like protein